MGKWLIMDWAAKHNTVQSTENYEATSICWAATKRIPSCRGARGGEPVTVMHCSSVTSLCWLVSHPGSRKQNQSLHTCAQDVQITRTTNNMVNRYNISLNYKIESLQNDPWVQKKYYRAARKSKRRCVFHRHNRRRGRSSLYLLAPAGTLGFDSNI
jgi:hypothetical protein